MHRVGLAVHHARGANHRAAERFADRLMTEAHAEDRQPAREVFEQRHAEACIGRSARARRQADAIGLHRLDVLDRHEIVAHDPDLFTELAEVLDEVVGEAVVVVDHQQHDSVAGERGSDEGMERGQRT